MRTDEQRRNDIRDEMLIDMARGIQIVLGMLAPQYSPALHINGRLDGHIQTLKIQMLEGAK